MDYSQSIPPTALPPSSTRIWIHDVSMPCPKNCFTDPHLNIFGMLSNERHICSVREFFHQTILKIKHIRLPLKFGTWCFSPCNCHFKQFHKTSCHHACVALKDNSGLGCVSLSNRNWSLFAVIPFPINETERGLSNHGLTWLLRCKIIQQRDKPLKHPLSAKKNQALTPKNEQIWNHIGQIPSILHWTCQTRPPRGRFVMFVWTFRVSLQLEFFELPWSERHVGEIRCHDFREVGMFCRSWPYQNRATNNKWGCSLKMVGKSFRSRI